MYFRFRARVSVVFVLVPFLLIHMSLIKLKKSNRRPIPVSQNQRQHKPVFLGIGKRLQQQSYHIQHREIGWWCGGGRNSNKAVKWMKDNLETELQLINQTIWLYVLIGTCDFTNSNPSTKIIDLKYTETKEIVNHLVNNYKQIQQLLETLSPNSKVTQFLQYHSTQLRPGIKNINIKSQLNSGNKTIN